MRFLLGYLVGSYLGSEVTKYMIFMRLTGGVKR